MRFSSELEHSSSTILSLLKGCKTIRDFNQVHTQIIRGGCEQDHFLITHFISICAAVLPSNLSYPTAVFDCVTRPNIYLWNVLMKSYCQNSSLNECFSFFRRMKRGLDVVPDKYTFPSVIKACSNVSALEEGRVIHGVTVRCGTDGDVFVGSSLVDFYGKCGQIGCARKVFDGMSVRNERNTATWNAMIKGLVRSGDLNCARNLFDEMPVRNEVSFTTLIDAYAKGGDMAAARSLFDQLTHKDLFSWSALMSGYVQNGKPSEAVKAFSEMQYSNLKPHEFIMVNLMSACSQLGCSELAKWIDSYMKIGSFNLRRAHVAAALIDMNAKCCNMDCASSLFEEMPERDLISYCSTIQGLCSIIKSIKVYKNPPEIAFQCRRNQVIWSPDEKVTLDSVDTTKDVRGFSLLI
ncbi:hypothetical protein ABFS83_08G101100 [Erythranthe nasuta]